MSGWVRAFFAWYVGHEIPGLFLFLLVQVPIMLGLALVAALAIDSGRLGGARMFRLVIFLPYAVPGFISILVFKGLFNRNFGEINLILDSLFGIRPNWTGKAYEAYGVTCTRQINPRRSNGKGRGR